MLLHWHQGSYLGTSKMPPGEGQGALTATPDFVRDAQHGQGCPCFRRCCPGAGAGLLVTDTPMLLPAPCLPDIV